MKATLYVITSAPLHLEDVTPFSWIVIWDHLEKIEVALAMVLSIEPGRTLHSTRLALVNYLYGLSEGSDAWLDEWSAQDAGLGFGRSRLRNRYKTYWMPSDFNPLGSDQLFVADKPTRFRLVEIDGVSYLEIEEL